MSSNNFINQSDPTAPLNFNNIDIREQYSKLTDAEKTMIAAKLLGMNHVPVDILTFLCDDYFLGDSRITNHGNSVFNFWKEQLPIIFPSPVITKTPYLSFGGCIGSGKSFISKMIGLYHYHRLDCCYNVFNSLGLAGGTKLAMGFFHASEETAYRDFVQFFKLIMEISPYFRKQYNTPPIRLISSGPKSTGSVIGTQLIYCERLRSSKIILKMLETY